MTTPISTYCYYRTKYHISQENSLDFVQDVENSFHLLVISYKVCFQTMQNSIVKTLLRYAIFSITSLLYISHEKK